MNIVEKARRAKELLEKAEENYDRIEEPTQTLPSCVKVQLLRDGRVSITDVDSNTARIPVTDCQELISILKEWGVTND